MYKRLSKYLHTFLIICLGFLPEINEIVNYKPVSDRDDDQLYYTKIYLEKSLRESLKISLDHNSAIFQNLNGALCKYIVKVNSLVCIVNNLHVNNTF